MAPSSVNFSFWPIALLHDINTRYFPLGCAVAVWPAGEFREVSWWRHMVAHTFGERRVHVEEIRRQWKFYCFIVISFYLTYLMFHVLYLLFSIQMFSICIFTSKVRYHHSSQSDVDHLRHQSCHSTFYNYKINC